MMMLMMMMMTMMMMMIRGQFILWCIVYWLHHRIDFTVKKEIY